MKRALRIYSDILQLRTEAFAALKVADGGMRYAMAQFITVALVAGLGIWLGLPALVQQPLLTEHIDQVTAFVERIDASVVPEVNAFLDNLSQENLSVALADLVPEGTSLSAETLSQLIDRADIGAAQMRDAVMAQASNLSAEERAQLEGQMAAIEAQIDAQEVVSPEQIDQVLAQASLTADDVADYLEQVPSAQPQLDALRAQAGQGASQLESLLAQIPFSWESAQPLLARLALKSERLKSATIRLGLTPEQLATLRANIDMMPEEVNAVLGEARAKIERVQPPLGVRFSRTVRVFGEWLSTPFQLMADWTLFALLLLLAAKLIGGRGTLRQHVIGMLLASAPLVLLFFTYVPNVAPAMPQSMDLAFDLFGRILALVGIAWAGLILLKAMAVTHEFSMWRSASAVALTWLIIYVVVPAASLLAAGYILRG